jgi:hypothetical protein
MTDRFERAGGVWRVLENAGVLAFASLLAMSLVMERYTGALLWLGALLVFFAQAWEARLRSAGLPPGLVRPAQLFNFLETLRRTGVGLSLIGVAALVL